MLLIGPNNLGSGFVGQTPDLINVDDYGDPFFDVDFRSVYSTVLQDWMCLDEDVADFVIGQPIDTINGLVPPGTPSVGSNDTAVY